MPKWQIAVLLTSLSVISHAQTPTVTNSEKLPEKLTFWLYPDALSGRRGRQLDVAQIKQTNPLVTANITMYGVGQDRCRIQGHPAEGSFDGVRLVLKAKVEPGDNLTCPMALELTRTSDGKFEGRYTNAQFAGVIKPE